MPSQTRRSSRIRSSAAKKIQKHFKSRKRKIQRQRQRSSATRKIQLRARAKIQGNKARTLIARVKDSKATDNNCSICLEPMNNNVATALPCGHRFHKDCIVNWLVRSQGKCPNCKQRITNIPYISNEEELEQEQEQEYEPLILDPILRRQYILERMHEIELLGREIEELTPQVPDPPEIPNIHFLDALSNQYSANQTEYYVRRLYNEASYNYNNYRSLNINDETLEQDVSNMFFITSELLTRARDNSRNARRICNHIGDIEFAEYM